MFGLVMVLVPRLMRDRRKIVSANADNPSGIAFARWLARREDLTDYKRLDVSPFPIARTSTLTKGSGIWTGLG